MLDIKFLWNRANFCTMVFLKKNMGMCSLRWIIPKFWKVLLFWCLCYLNRLDNFWVLNFKMYFTVSSTGYNGTVGCIEESSTGHGTWYGMISDEILNAQWNGVNMIWESLTHYNMMRYHEVTKGFLVFLKMFSRTEVWLVSDMIN